MCAVREAESKDLNACLDLGPLPPEQRESKFLLFKATSCTLSWEPQGLIDVTLLFLKITKFLRTNHRERNRLLRDAVPEQRGWGGAVERAGWGLSGHPAPSPQTSSPLASNPYQVHGPFTGRHVLCPRRSDLQHDE